MYSGGGGDAEIVGPGKGQGEGATQCLYDSAFNFSIPSAANVTAITITFTEYMSVESGTKAPVVYSANPVIDVEGEPTCNVENTNSPAESNGSPRSVTLGGSVLGGVACDPAIINSANFGIWFRGYPQFIQGKNTQEYVYIESPKVTVTYTP